jgi:tetratricopeptide (TPR) repeat protein
MARAIHSAARLARRLWEERNLDALAELASAEASSRDPKVLYYGGLAFHARNNKRRAVECWREAARLAPAYADPVRALAYEMTERENFIDASDLFQQLIHSGKATPDDLTALGEICIKQGRLAEAKKLLDAALESEPANALALLALATANAHMRNETAALELLRRAAETEELDLTELDSDPTFQFLWGVPEFEAIMRT